MLPSGSLVKQGSRDGDAAQNLRLHDTYRYPKPAPKRIAEGSEEGLESFFAATQWPPWPGLENAGRAQLEKGIDAITMVSASDGPRRPAILIGINPHKAGSDWTPWHDEIDPRNGFVRYYGDNKPGLSESPDHTSGNRAILAQFELSASNRSDDRRRACPLMFFESVIQENRSKGYRRFRGVGLVDRIERVVQVDRHGRPFVNYRYDCVLFSLAAENNLLDWTWIAARRDASKTLAESAVLAPAAWRTWIERGSESFDHVRQRLLTYRILSDADQRPLPGSTADSALRATLAYYENRPKSRFEPSRSASRRPPSDRQVCTDWGGLAADQAIEASTSLADWILGLALSRCESLWSDRQSANWAQAALRNCRDSPPSSTEGGSESS